MPAPHEEHGTAAPLRTTPCIPDRGLHLGPERAALNYIAQFANGSAEWRIGLLKDGTIGRIARGSQY
jgi:hypothetical protein